MFINVIIIYRIDCYAAEVFKIREMYDYIMSYTNVIFINCEH